MTRRVYLKEIIIGLQRRGLETSDLLKMVALISAVLCAVALSGCIQSSEEIVVDEEGMATINFSAIADKSLAGDELAQLAWQMEQLIPQLNTMYNRSTYTYEEDLSEYLVYEWKAKNKIPVTEVKGVTWTADNETYEFHLELEQLFDPAEVNETDLDEVIMDITLTMPEAIDIANTPFVDADTARWTINKEMLTKKTTLSAITE